MEQPAYKNQEKFIHRVIALLNKDELEYLNKLGRDSLYSTGHRLSYNQIIKALIHHAMEAGLSGENAKDVESLKKKISVQAKPKIEETCDKINKMNSAMPKESKALPWKEII